MKTAHTFIRARTQQIGSHRWTLILIIISNVVLILWTCQRPQKSTKTHSCIFFILNSLILSPSPNEFQAFTTLPYNKIRSIRKISTRFPLSLFHSACTRYVIPCQRRAKQKIHTHKYTYTLWTPYNTLKKLNSLWIKPPAHLHKKNHFNFDA